MKMTGMMIVTTIETGFRIALRTSRQAIANVALASRSIADRMPAGAPPAGRAATMIGAHAASSELAERARRTPPRGWARGPGARSAASGSG